MKYCSILLIALFSVSACKKDTVKPTPSLIGNWSYEYQLNKDGTKDFSNPYALVVFDYSDGFILNEDKTGVVLWYNAKKNYKFRWYKDNDKLRMYVKRSDSTESEFVGEVLELSEQHMMFKNAKNIVYKMNKY